MHNLDLTMEHLTKVEGSASLDVRVRSGKVEYVQFKITEHKRFFTKAMEGKPIAAIPQLLSRICGTCSNAHLLASIESCERALGIEPSEQTMLLRQLTMHGLIIRDHALHLYLFALPDIYGKDAFLDFDENDSEQHQLLHDGFAIKAAGNFLATLIAGRSVHAVHPTVGGFLHFPEKEGIVQALVKLHEIRPAVLRLIAIFEKAPFHFERTTRFVALVPEHYGYIGGDIATSIGDRIPREHFRDHFEHVVLPYSQASAYQYGGESYMVGALSRMNLMNDRLHPLTKQTVGKTLDLFPSNDVFHNNLAQAIEILHSIDEATDILQRTTFVSEPIVKKPPREAVGIGVVEAPRGTLYHKVLLNAKGIVEGGEIVVPTGQNQRNIEEDIATLIERIVSSMSQEKIEFEVEKLIRAYDPCMSCASHFLKVKWQ